MICTNRFRLLATTKDGGPESRVWAYWLFAWKALFSIVLLRFEDGSRDAYHDHAFSCFSWVLSGRLSEIRIGWDEPGVYERRASWRPFVTRRTHLHKVVSHGRTWVLSFRGPWARTWREQLPSGAQRILTHGRVELSQ